MMVMMLTAGEKQDAGCNQNTEQGFHDDDLSL